MVAYPKAFAFSVLSVFFAFSANVATAQDETTNESSSSFLDQTEVHGFVSSSYNYNFNDPQSNTNAFRSFDPDHNTFNIDGIELVFLKEANSDSKVGFRFDLMAGSTIPEGSHSTGLFENQDFDLQQGYVSYFANAGEGLTIDAGKFITHVGTELIDGYDGYNENYSRGVVFNFAGPFTHTGVRANYQINDNNSLMFMVANGWDNTKDNNEGKTFGLQYATQPTEAVDLYFNYVGGPEQNDESDNYRHLFDFVGNFDVHEKVDLTANAVYGTEKDAINGTDNASWFGAALLSRITLHERFYLGVRAEYLNDMDGSRIGNQEMWTFTATPTFKVTDNAVFRFEVRHDRSDQNVFEDDNGAGKKHQTTAALNAIYTF